MTINSATEVLKADGTVIPGLFAAGEVTGGVHGANRLGGTAVEDEYGNTPAQRAELDWLLYNKPLEYAQLVLGGGMKHYLSLGCGHGRLQN